MVTIWDTIIAAAAITGLSEAITTLLVGMMGLTMLFVGYKWIKRGVFKSIAVAFLVLAVAEKSYAGVWDDIITAASITGLSTAITTLLVGMMGLTMLFVGYKWIKRGVFK